MLGRDIGLTGRIASQWLGLHDCGSMSTCLDADYVQTLKDAEGVPLDFKTRGLFRLGGTPLHHPIGCRLNGWRKTAICEKPSQL